eukprot:CAMPEP_0116927554 /NCGR_PEP_ID=MMETSP0467-20121206/25432_1 /TAXON_ID=283647 /ORGANISM="Mesodinium pulex, Strain SPMC105" /LENGTH=41 /DNA_ID= /DNA_START= /DNA_END= /DNA_ORIENTATION=
MTTQSLTLNDFDYLFQDGDKKKKEDQNEKSEFKAKNTSASR